MSLYSDGEDVEDDYVDEPDDEFMPIHPRLGRRNNEECVLDHALKHELELDVMHYDFDGNDVFRRAHRHGIYDRIMEAYRLGTQVMNGSIELNDSDTQSGTSKILALLKRPDAPELLRDPEVQDRIKEFMKNDDKLRKKLFHETLDKLKGRLNSEEHLKEIATKEIKQDMAENNENNEVNEIDVEGIIDCLKDLPTVLLNDIQMKVLKVVPENILCLLQLQFYGVVDINYSLKGSNKEVSPLLLTTMGNKLIKSINLDYVSVDNLYRGKYDYDVEIGDYLVIDTYYSNKIKDVEQDLSLPRFYRYSEAYFNRYFGKQFNNSNKVEELTETTETPNEQPQDDQGGFSWL